jgi:hypothetical protein
VEQGYELQQKKKEQMDASHSISQGHKPARQGVGIVRWIEKLLFACSSMSLDSCYSAR